MARLKTYPPQRRGGNKFGNHKTEFNGLLFDSKREARRYAALLKLEEEGKIHYLERQVKFELIPNQRDERGKVIERAVNYYADFVYQDENGDTVVEDAKGFRTDKYTIKRKLLLYRFGLRIREV